MKHFLPLLLLLVACVLDAHADGKVFPKTAYPAEVTIPDQRALIHFKGGTERLVIETRFTGSGTNFCWVVPLPSAPVVEEATTGLFPTLAFFCKPKLIHNAYPFFGGFGICFILVYLVIALPRSGDIGLRHLIFPALLATGICFVSPVIGFVGLAFVFWTYRRMEHGESSLIGLLLSVLLLLLLSSMLLPSLAASRSTTTSLVSELDRKRVGVFEVTTISSTNSVALLEWLRNNGFETSRDSEKVITDYVKDGWVFCTATLSKDSPALTTNSIHPLSFTFKTDHPVYPMRLTGATSQPLSVEVYLVGPETASARHFKTLHCAKTVSTNAYRSGSPDLPLSHPLLNQWLQPGETVTRLSARLSPTEMKEDVLFQWKPFKQRQETLFSHKGASIIAANISAGLLFIGFTGMLLRMVLQRQAVPLTRLCATCIGVAVALWGACYLSFPKVPVKSSSFPVVRMASHLRRLQTSIADRLDRIRPKTLNEARAIVETELGSKERDNLLLGGNIREEDSPGNYALRQTTNGFVFVWFDAYGGEHTPEEERH